MNLTSSINVFPLPGSDGKYPYKTTVYLTALAADDEIFVGWAGDLTGSSSSSYLILNGDKNVIADFTHQRVSLKCSTRLL